MKGENKQGNKALMRRQKGWIGFVRSYKTYINDGSYDEVKWGKGTKSPKDVTVDVMGKITYKF